MKAIHFVGFKGEEYHTAVKVWGPPHFIHRGWDLRAQRDIAEGDVVVLANGTGLVPPSVRSFDDYDEPDDPAVAERRGTKRSDRP